MTFEEAIGMRFRISGMDQTPKPGDAREVRSTEYGGLASC